MKKKHFFSVWAKTLTTAALLIAGGLTAVCAGWSLIGLSSGMNVNEIMSPVSYEESQKAERYVRRELQDQLGKFSSENKILKGSAYNGDLTLDISNLNDGTSINTSVSDFKSHLNSKSSNILTNPSNDKSIPIFLIILDGLTVKV